MAEPGNIGHGYDALLQQLLETVRGSPRWVTPETAGFFQEGPTWQRWKEALLGANNPQHALDAVERIAQGHRIAGDYMPTTAAMRPMEPIWGDGAAGLSNTAAKTIGVDPSISSAHYDYGPGPAVKVPGHMDIPAHELAHNWTYRAMKQDPRLLVQLLGENFPYFDPDTYNDLVRQVESSSHATGQLLRRSGDTWRAFGLQPLVTPVAEKALSKYAGTNVMEYIAEQAARDIGIQSGADLKGARPHTFPFLQLIERFGLKSGMEGAATMRGVLPVAGAALGGLLLANQLGGFDGLDDLPVVGDLLD